jgi:hypothetical protein
MHPHKISDRYDSPNPFKKCCDRVVKCERAASDQIYNLDFFYGKNRGKKVVPSVFFTEHSVTTFNYTEISEFMTLVANRDT